MSSCRPTAVSAPTAAAAGSGVNDNNSSAVGAGSRCFVVRPAEHRRVTPATADDDMQPQLMEARLIELVSSLKQLVHSNDQLEVAWVEDEDDVYIEALRENEGVISRKCESARTLAKKLRQFGLDVSIEGEIPVYPGSTLLRRLEAEAEERRSAETNTGTASEEKGDDDGIYL